LWREKKPRKKSRYQSGSTNTKYLLLSCNIGA
jgi:hypothetical protein